MSHESQIEQLRQDVERLAYEVQSMESAMRRIDILEKDLKALRKYVEEYEEATRLSLNRIVRQQV